MPNEDRLRPWLSLQSAALAMQKRLGDESDDVADFLLKAATGISEGATRIEAVVPTILANKLGSPLANEKAARDAVGKLTASILKRVDQASTFARGAIAKVTEQTSPKPPSDATGAIYHSEVRSVLARMPAAERSKAIREAIDTSDDRFVAAAVLGAPILTGLSPAEQQMFLETWRSWRHPEKAARLTRWKAGLAELDRLGPMFLKWGAQIFDEPDAAAVTAGEKSAEIARAAAAADVA